MTNLALDVPPSDFSPRNRDLISCLLTSRRMSDASLTVLYRQVTFPHGRVFSKFLAVLEAAPELGALTWRLDLSHLSSLGLGRTRAANGATPHFTRTTFRRCLELLPGLQEVLLSEHVVGDCDAEILQKILFGLPYLRSLDFCGMSTSAFGEAFAATMATRAAGTMLRNLQNLCLHECSTLAGEDLAALLGALPRLRMLDLHHTSVTDTALRALPATARLTHLNLGRCSQISGEGVVDFFACHPAVQGLVYLNLGSDISRHRLLGEDDVDALLPLLPRTLRSLNLNGAALRANNMALLVALSKHLEELSLSNTRLDLPQIRALISPHSFSDHDEAPASSVRFIDLTGVASVTQAALFGNATSILGSISQPLEAIEISSPLATSLGKATNMNSRLGWAVKEFGRRSWYVRAHSASDPQRNWKMGSRWWGMRKIPVAWSDVGGIYGHYMFKAGVAN